MREGDWRDRPLSSTSGTRAQWLHPTQTRSPFAPPGGRDLGCRIGTSKRLRRSVHRNRDTSSRESPSRHHHCPIHAGEASNELRQSPRLTFWVGRPARLKGANCRQAIVPKSPQNRFYANKPTSPAGESPPPRGIA